MVEHAVVLLAGGEARRFPGKLECSIDGVPLLTRTYRRLRETGWPVYLAGKGSFEASLDAQLDAPLIIDRAPGQGPLRAFIAACTVIAAERIFAVAADQPSLDAGVLRRLAQQRKDGDEAVVPRHGDAIEPLAALYVRRALLRESGALRRRRAAAMRDAIALLATRFVPCDPASFQNVNRPDDLRTRSFSQ